MAKIKNIIIFAAIGVALILVYIFFIKKAPEEGNLTTIPNSILPEAASPLSGDTSVGQDFLTLLLNVKNIKLNDSIFSDPAFTSLHDSSIVLIQDGNEGRANPFAPIGSDSMGAPVAPTAPLDTTGMPTN